MDVYVCLLEFDYEGSSLQGVFAREDQAKAFMQYGMQEFYRADGRTWKEETPSMAAGGEVARWWAAIPHNGSTWAVVAQVTVHDPK